MELRGVGKRYGGSRDVLSGVDLTVRPGEVIAVTGGNGSGKSTLLRIVVGLSQPSSGTVTGRPPIVGYVPERFPIHQRISALAYLVHMGRIRGLDGREAAARARSLLDTLTLAGGSGTSLRRLSKGNAQKVALAQALLVPPHLLVLDEPWSGLDTSAHDVLVDLIAGVAEGGGAVMFTDHRDAVVRANASTVYRIAGGALSLVDDGSLVASVELAVARQAVEVDWKRLPGVLGVAEERDAVSLEVADEHCDELLYTAIRSGWSVRSVRR
jgi:ABC-type multidrug transport system ATPase subunit